MKKLLLLLFIAAMGINADAQDAFTFGFKGGASFYSYDTEFLFTPPNNNIRDYSQETLPGLVFGAFSKIYLGGPLYFQPEVYYARKSTKENLTYIEGAVPMTITKNNVMHFIDVPLLLNATIFDFTYAGKLFGLAGPTTTFLTSVKEDYGSNFGSVNNEDNKDLLLNALKNDMHTVNFTVQAGIGYEIRKFHVDLRYERSLGNLSQENFDMTLNSFMVNVGLKFM